MSVQMHAHGLWDIPYGYSFLRSKKFLRKIISVLHMLVQGSGEERAQDSV